MPSFKDIVKTLREATLASLEAHGVSVDTDAVCEQDALLLMAISALKELERLDNVTSECAEAAKTARKSLKTHLTSSTGAGEEEKQRQKRTREQSEEDQQLELGQYATSDAFDGNDKKKAKFARLMGGAKLTSGGTRHNTHAADSKTIHKMNTELESQFDYALQHKGKKGLGA